MIDEEEEVFVTLSSAKEIKIKPTPQTTTDEYDSFHNERHHFSLIYSHPALAEVKNDLNNLKKAEKDRVQLWDYSRNEEYDRRMDERTFQTSTPSYDNNESPIPSNSNSLLKSIFGEVRITKKKWDSSTSSNDNEQISV